MHTIVIDCGASFLKGAVFSEDGEILMKQQRHAPVVCRDEEIDKPLQITELLINIKKMLSGLAKAGKGRNYRLCISNEMHGFLLADKNGNPLTDYISWQKEYGKILVNGTSSMEDLETEELAEDILYTGMKLRSSLPSCNLQYLWKKGFFAKKQEEIYFYTLGDYILRQLSGKEPFCHPTNAAATGLFDLRRGDWNSKLTTMYKRAGIIFPQIGENGINFELEGKVFWALPAIGDQQAALLGAGLCHRNEMSFNLGTGAQVTRLTENVRPASEYQIRPYFYGYYLKTIPHLPSGRALNVYFRFIKDVLKQFDMEITDDQIWEKVLETEKKGENTAMKFDLSFFQNPLTLFDKGSIKNIGEYDLTLGNLFRAVFIQMSDNFSEAAERLGREQIRIEKLIFSGGIAHKITPICSRIIEKYGKNIEYIVTDNETLMGLYKYGGL